MRYIIHHGPPFGVDRILTCNSTLYITQAYASHRYPRNITITNASYNDCSIHTHIERE